MKKNSRNEMIAVTVAIIVVAVILFIGVLNNLSSGTQDQNVGRDTNIGKIHGSGLITKEVVIGNGTEAVAGLVVTTHYVGTLDDGTVFDSSVARGAPFSFTLGTGQVIRGWDLGILGMKVGGVRELTIPARLAYGNRAIGVIPADATLHFTVQLLGVGSQ